jgi:hypothetical protein
MLQGLALGKVTTCQLVIRCCCSLAVFFAWLLLSPVRLLFIAHGDDSCKAFFGELVLSDLHAQLHQRCHRIHEFATPFVLPACVLELLHACMLARLTPLGPVVDGLSFWR